MIEDDPKKLSDETVTTLRKLAHDLSNAIENVMQASYLLGQAKLGDQNAKWLALINTAAQDAARINRQIRDILRSNSKLNPSQWRLCCLRNQLGIHGDLRVQHARHRATGFGRLRRFFELRLVRSRNLHGYVQVRCRNCESGVGLFQRHRSGRVDAFRSHSRIAELRRQGHAEASCMSRGQQFLWICSIPFSNRVPNEYWALLSTPLAVEMVPLPSFNPPDQWALPVRCISSPCLAEIAAN